MKLLNVLWFFLCFGTEPHEHRMERIAADTRACQHVDGHGRRCSAWDGEQVWT